MEGNHRDTTNMNNEEHQGTSNTCNEIQSETVDNKGQPKTPTIGEENCAETALDDEVSERPPPNVDIVPREEWSKIPLPEGGEQFNHPVQNVMVTHTGTKSCSKSTDCVKVVKQLQRHHIALGHPDIIYNFLLGGDGKIYEGRGWYWKGGHIPKYPESFGECVKIAHIGYYGDYSKHFPGPEMIKLQYDFIETGMHKELVAWNATIIPDYNE